MSFNSSGATTEVQTALAQRFLRYSAISSQSNAEAESIPSSSGQWELAKLLQQELLEAGAQEVHLSETAVLTAKIPGNKPDAPAIGFCTHLDTVDVSLSPQVNAKVVEYTGGDICLNKSQDIWLKASEHPEITRYVGQKILVTDGTSVLGADDKAGITAVMEAVVRVLKNPKALAEPRGDIYLSFVPDEEIGLRGVRTMEMDRFKVDYAYTIDSCELGELVESTFNAGEAKIQIKGVSAHPMNAKGIMVNPILVANEIISRLDPLKTPEQTEGREGYLWVRGISANQSEANLDISIRDYDLRKYEGKKQFLINLVDQVNKANPRAKIFLEILDIYRNLEDAKTAENSAAIEHLREAMQELKIKPIELSMRGGTDGSYLSTKGIYTPNFFTGAHNFHSIYEFLPLPSFEKCYEMVRFLFKARN